MEEAVVVVVWVVVVAAAEEAEEVEVLTKVEEAEDVPGGRRRWCRAGASRRARHRAGAAGESSVGPGNAYDARGDVDDAGELAGGLVGMRSCEESGEGGTASDGVERVGRESESDVGEVEQTRGGGG